MVEDSPPARRSKRAARQRRVFKASSGRSDTHRALQPEPAARSHRNHCAQSDLRRVQHRGHGAGGHPPRAARPAVVALARGYIKKLYVQGKFDDAWVLRISRCRATCGSSRSARGCLRIRSRASTSTRSQRLRRPIVFARAASEGGATAIISRGDCRERRGSSVTHRVLSGA